MGFAYKSAAESDYTSSVAASVFGNTATATLTGLQAGMDYTVYAYASANGQQYTSGTASFTTKTQQILTDHTAWFELPAKTTGSSTLTMSFYDGSDRNYTMYYDKSTYTADWVAYPLASGHISTGRKGEWKATPGIPTSDQINIWTSSYGVNYGSTTNEGYNGNLEIYARGHQIPNADRNANDVMQAQTFYAANSTPQIQNKFNASIWSSLEGSVRTIAKATDTVYVVTGAVLRKVGGSEEVTYILPKNETVKQCPVPNYYYKVLLKVKRSGSTITDASAIGVWLPHAPYSSNDFSGYVTSVAQIEAWTGYDYFANLPDDLEATAERNTSWSAFSAF